MAKEWESRLRACFHTAKESEMAMALNSQSGLAQLVKKNG
jgi:hypothetical protein